MPAGFSIQDFQYILPEIVLTAGALLLLVVDLLTSRQQQRVLGWCALAVLGATALTLLPFSGANLVVSRGLLAIDGFAFFFKLIFLGSAAITILMSSSYLEAARYPGNR